MGTELDRRGVPTHLPLWSAWGLIHAPKQVAEIHLEYALAGAEISTTNTFRTHRRSLDKAGLGNRAEELTHLAVQLAHQAPSTWVAGSMAPLEDCFSPELTPPDTVLEAEHQAFGNQLAGAGVDLMLVETMPTIREARAATQAAMGTKLPTLVGLTCDESGCLHSGETVTAAVEALAPLEPDGLLINCTLATTLINPLTQLREATDLPIGAYGNVGHAEDDSSSTNTGGVDPNAYAALAAGWLELGAMLIGSCCGARPAHTHALASLLQTR